MKKLLALLLVALILLSLPLGPVLADGEDGAAASETTEKPHDKPRWSKSLKYWEQEELPKLTLTGNFREDLLTVARAQLGYTADKSCYQETASGKKRYYTRYGAWDGATFAEWCDSFVSFCIYYAGNKSYPGESSCERHMFRLKAAGYWREWNAYIPKKGDIVFFTLSKNHAAPNHVGLVEEVVLGEGDTAGYLITIEGNMANPKGGMNIVRRMTRSLDQVVGYGTYEQGKTYPEADTFRSNGWTIIDEESVYFIEYPKEEVLRFLGLYGSRYYEYWFPEEPIEEEPEAEAPAEEAPAEEAPEMEAPVEETEQAPLPEETEPVPPEETAEPTNET